MNDALSEFAPVHVAVAGDWHGNIAWASAAIEAISALLPPDGLRLILHLGDFRLWPGPAAQLYLTHLAKKLEQHRMILWFVDGNHEWHQKLANLHQDAPGPVATECSGRIWHLPRGTRWTWYGTRWLAVGGAGSPDWQRRIPYQSWWPDEVISPEETAQISADGEADVLIAHDCPWLLMPELPKPPAWWDLEPCIESSQRLQLITLAAQPQRVIHGHLHLYRDDMQIMPWGPVHVTGMSYDGGPENWGIMDTRTLEITQLND